MVTVQVKARVQRNFAVQHLLGAAEFTRQTAILEKELAGEHFDSRWQPIIWLVTAAIKLSISSTEAFFNELMKARSEKPVIIKLIDRVSLLEKHNLYLEYLDIPSFQLGENPGQDMKILIRLRNALTHFSPEFDDEQAEHAKLSSQLKDKFEPTAIYGPSEPIFPTGIRTANCARWAVKTVLEFNNAFAGKLGADSPFNNHESEFEC